MAVCGRWVYGRGCTEDWRTVWCDMGVQARHRSKDKSDAARATEGGRWLVLHVVDDSSRTVWSSGSQPSWPHLQLDLGRSEAVSRDLAVRRLGGLEQRVAAVIGQLQRGPSVASETGFHDRRHVPLSQTGSLHHALFISSLKF